MPLEKKLRISNEQDFGNRLDDLATALKVALAMTEDCRKYNRERLARKANERQISPGDSEWVLTRVKGPGVYVYTINGRVRLKF